MKKLDIHETVNVVVAGVGGQGTLLAGRIIGGAAARQGLDAKVSEVHGMSQRGGSVITFVRFGKKTVYSPVVDPGRAELLLGFELLEAYRCVPFLKSGGLLIANTQTINPMPVITGAAVYPARITEKLRGFDIQVETMDALALAAEAGSPRAVNMALIGRMAAFLPIPADIWRDVLRETVKPAFIDINLKAFDAGYTKRV